MVFISSPPAASTRNMAHPSVDHKQSKWAVAQKVPNAYG
jgi:hypothetical protein